MGKAFGAFVRWIAALFIIALVGYNTFEINRLRAEVATLRGETPAARSGAAEQLAEAQSHAERAKTLLGQKKFSEATAEMQAASDAAARASGNAQAQSRSAIAGVQKSLAELSEKTAALWRQAEAATTAAKNTGGSAKSAPLSEKKNDAKQNK
ncbi:MAG: hypothetical protein H7Y38_03945 [Armatimonadetes bacterium]|nr:hypothetical protein [Armatimonadota bacterium]